MPFWELSVKWIFVALPFGIVRRPMHSSLTTQLLTDLFWIDHKCVDTL